MYVDKDELRRIPRQHRESRVCHSGSGALMPRDDRVSTAINLEIFVSRREMKVVIFL